MKKVIRIALSATLLAPFSVAASPEDEVKQVFQRFMLAQNAHDVDGVGELLLDSPDFLWITRGTAIWGRKAALEQFQTLFRGTWQLEPEMASLRVTRVTDNTARLYVPIVFTIGPAGGKAQSTRFLMNQFLVKTGKGWRVASILPIPIPSGGPAQQTGTSLDSASIIALELEMARLLARRAFDEYEKHLAPDYARTTRDGKLETRAEALAVWRTQTGAGQEIVPTEMWVRLYGDAAILTARLSGRGGAPGARITKTFVRKNGVWLLAALHGSSSGGPQ